MTANNCVRCGRPTPDGYADPVCGVERPRAWLAEIADMVVAARDIAQRQARHGVGGGASGKPGSRELIDFGATARLDTVGNKLTTWARHVAEERGLNQAQINVDGLTWSTRVSGWVDQHGDAVDDLSVSALWLSAHCEWMRHRPECDEFLSEIETCAQVIRGIARGPAAKVYLGPCGAEHPTDCSIDGPECRYVPPCEGDVYGLKGGRRGTCRTCGAQVDQGERREWLDDQVRDKAFRAAHIADAYRIPVKTIRSWGDRGHLLEHGQDFLGRPLYLVGDVLNLAAEAAARRAENEAKRAVREAAEMGA